MGRVERTPNLAILATLMWSLQGMSRASVHGDGLVEGLHLFVYPLTRGSGSRLFADGAPAPERALAGCRSYANRGRLPAARAWRQIDLT
jgi:hypothetical protein